MGPTKLNKGNPTIIKTMIKYVYVFKMVHPELRILPNVEFNLIFLNKYLSHS